jgi:hypothetical protein
LLIEIIEKGKKQARKEKEARERKENQETNKKQAKGKGEQANQEASKQIPPHVLGFGRYPLSHKPSRPSKREAKKQDLDQILITQGSHMGGGCVLFLPQM